MCVQEYLSKTHKVVAFVLCGKDVVSDDLFVALVLLSICCLIKVHKAFFTKYFPQYIFTIKRTLQVRQKYFAAKALLVTRPLFAGSESRNLRLYLLIRVIHCLDDSSTVIVNYE